MDKDVNSRPHLSPAQAPCLSVSPQTPPSWMACDLRGRRRSLPDSPVPRQPPVKTTGMMSLSHFVLGDVGDLRGFGVHDVGCGQQHFQWAGALTVGRSGPQPVSSQCRWGRSRHVADHPGSRGRGGSGCSPLELEPSAADSMHMGTDREGLGFKSHETACRDISPKMGFLPLFLTVVYAIVASFYAGSFWLMQIRPTQEQLSVCDIGFHLCRACA